jgi:hypothetical protein
MNAKRKNANRILAGGWRLARATLDLKGMEIPDTIEFLIDDVRQTLATRVATLEELAKGLSALDDTIEHPTDDEDRANRLYRYVDQEQLHKDRDGLVELQKLTSYGGAPPSTTVIEALFPWVPVTKKTAAEKAEIERRLTVVKEEAFKIDPDTAEIHHSHTRYFDPYNVLDEWELPEELQEASYYDWVSFARAPGSDIWVEFHDLPCETRERLLERLKTNPRVSGGSEEEDLVF